MRKIDFVLFCQFTVSWQTFVISKKLNFYQTDISVDFTLDNCLNHFCQGLLGTHLNEYIQSAIVDILDFANYWFDFIKTYYFLGCDKLCHS